MNIIIAGCNKVGISLASELCRTGHEVAVIDRDAGNFAKLPALFHGVTVEGVAMDVSALEKAGIAGCDAFAAVDDDDNLNIVASQLARDMYRVKTIVTRVSDPVREQVFQTMGMKTICPTNIEGAELYNMITGETYDSLVSFGNRKARFSTRTNKKWVGRQLCDVPVLKGEIVYAVVGADGDISLADNPGRIVKEDESIVFSSLVD